MAFQPQSMTWPGSRAVLLVHGIGDASTGKDGAFPLDVLKGVLGDAGGDVAIYRIGERSRSATSIVRPARGS